MDRKAYADDSANIIAWLNARDTQPQRNKHRLPIEQYALGDCEYFFTICARHQGTPFTDPLLARSIIDALLWRREHHSWFLFCYCLMPDHLHLILKLTNAEIRWINAGARGRCPEGVLDHIGRFKRYTTTQIWQRHGGNGALWQTSSYDRVIRYYNSIDDAVSYVLHNPVRKRIVENIEKYPYSSIVDQWR